MAVMFLQSYFANGNIEVRSAGVQARQGASLDPLAQAALEERGFAPKHQAQLVDMQSLAWADLILTMTRSQKFSLIHMTPMIADKVYTFNAYIGNPIHDIKAPSENHIQAYRDCAFEIESVCYLLYQAIQEEANLDYN